MSLWNRIDDILEKYRNGVEDMVRTGSSAAFERERDKTIEAIIDLIEEIN